MKEWKSEMEKFIMTKKEAVMLHGSDQCKEHFAKYGKFTNKDLETALIKTLNQIYESVEVIKEGRAYIYVLGKVREAIAEREDNRSKNGSWSIPYTKNMDIMVVTALEYNQIIETAQTLSKWCLDFGLITSEMYDLLRSQYQESNKEQCLQELKEKKLIYVGEERILNDFINITKTIQNQLAGTLNRMHKAKIIEYYPVPKGFVEKSQETINLHENTVKKILMLQRELMEYYDVNEWYLSTYYNTKKSRAFRSEWKEKLSQITDENGAEIGLSFWYKSYAIILKARKKKIIHYLETYNKEVIEQFKKAERAFLIENENAFYSKRTDYVMNQAQKKEEHFLEEKTKILELCDSVIEIYGATTKHEIYTNKREDFTYDENYYSLYFDRL